MTEQPQKKPAPARKEPGKAPPPPKKNWQEEFKKKIEEIWAGEVPLFQTFWIYLVALVGGMEILSFSLGFVGALAQMFAFCWAAFMIKAVWASADNYIGPKHYALGAKAGAIAMACLAFVLTTT